MNTNTQRTYVGLSENGSIVLRLLLTAIFFATGTLPALAFKEGISRTPSGAVEKGEDNSKKTSSATESQTKQPPKYVVCPDCDGERYISEGRCDFCDGVGWTRTPVTRGIGGRTMGGRKSQCDKCKGKGEIKKLCQTCRGRGKIRALPGYS